MSAKPNVKRTSMLGGLSVADRAKSFQTEADSAALPARPVMRRACKTEPSSSRPLSSSVALEALDAPASSSQEVLPGAERHELEAVIKHARRISVSTPLHRRASSDVGIIGSAVDSNGKEVVQDGASPDHIDPSTTHRTSFAEIDQMTADLKAKRPRSKTLAHPTRHGRVGSVLMHSIAEESFHIRMCSSIETIRPLSSTSTKMHPKTMLKGSQTGSEASPSHAEDGGLDWHRFVTANYSMQAPSDYRLPMSISGLVVPGPTCVCKDDSPTLNDEATWLEEELAHHSSSSSSSDDEQEIRQLSSSHSASHRSTDEDEYLTPEGSPLLSPLNDTEPPTVTIMGLGIEDAALAMPGHAQKDAAKSADSLLEQVALLEACVQSLHRLSRGEREQATAAASAGRGRTLIPPGLSTPERRCSLAVPGQEAALRPVVSRGDFCATQLENPALYGEASYDATSSPMADNGHGSTSNSFSSRSPDNRRASAASYLSTNSTASADLSIVSHGSSLLYNAHLAAPAMMRLNSTDTAMSTRPSSIASSSYSVGRLSVKQPISPVRVKAQPSPPLPTETSETPQPSGCTQSAISKLPEGLLRMAAMPLPPLPDGAAQVNKPRFSRQVRRRRKEGFEQPQLPARLDSLDSVVAAAPGEVQLKEEFPQRLLGDWMGSQHDDGAVEQRDGSDDEHAVSVEPVPLHERIRKKDGTTYLPGLGEIEPSSPDVGADLLAMASLKEIPAYPAARKRLGLEPAPSMLTATDSFVAYAASGMNKSTVSLKSKLSDRLGLSSSDNAVVTDADGPKKAEAKGSESSMFGRLRKASAASTSSRPSDAAAAEMPTAWKDRISMRRPSASTRRPSLSSLASVSTHSSSTSSAMVPTPTSAAAPSQRMGSTLLTPSMATGDARSRSSLSFKRMFSSNVDSIAKQTNASDSAVVDLTDVRALAASAFESPKSTRRPLPGSQARRQQQSHESFMELSDDDDDSVDVPAGLSVAGAKSVTDLTSYGGRSNGRKDLTKMFGASEVDLSQATAEVKKGKRWTASLSRSATVASRPSRMRS
uniref:Uncharacterized protein n=2 Tax=Kalmanozyma brasiliensis (strain GHG001) TaxID=1365824 RepID=V5EFG7_KALBG